MPDPVQVVVAQRILFEPVQRLVEQAGRDDGDVDLAEAADRLNQQVARLAEQARLRVLDDAGLGDERLDRAVGVGGVGEDLVLGVALLLKPGVSL